MTLNELVDGMTVTARLGRPGAEAVSWKPWKQYSLYVMRDKKGDLAVLALRNTNWAEYSKHDYWGNDGVLVCEDYYLEIKGLK